MRTIFIDMDGVLAVFDKNASIEEVATKGYFRKCEPMKGMIGAVKKIAGLMPDIRLVILSSVFQDGHSVADKEDWLDRYLPEIPRENRIFVPYGMSKRKYLSEISILDEKDILLDDFTKNLSEWHGIGIKVMNGINGTKGTWKGYKVFADSSSEIISNTIMGISMVA